MQQSTVEMIQCTFRPRPMFTALTFPIRRKDVDAECRHDMWPFIQLPSISGADSKLGLTMVRPSLQLALDLPPVSERVRQICRNFFTGSFFDVWWPWPLTFSTENCTPLTHALSNAYTNFDLSTLLFAYTGQMYRQDGQTAGKQVMRPIGQLHNK